MDKRWTRKLWAGMAVGLLALGGAAPARAGAEWVSLENVTAYAQAQVSTCPWVPPGAPGIVCVDTFVWYFQAGFSAVPQAGYPVLPGAKQPWILGVAEETWVSVDEEEFELTDVRYNFVTDADGYVDAQHMRVAAVRGSVPMSEGDPIAVDLQWDLSDAELQTAGNDGPVEGSTWGGSGRDGCQVRNLLAHQRWRWDFDGITGTIGGHDIETHYYLPNEFPSVFIEGRSTFKIIINETGVNCE
jgi:hypothetical protein